jgi:hypothetical protein
VASVAFAVIWAAFEYDWLGLRIPPSMVAPELR